jgi:hypothetical protein
MEKEESALDKKWQASVVGRLKDEVIASSRDRSHSDLS